MLSPFSNASERRSGLAMEGVETATHATNVRSVISSFERRGPSQGVQNNVIRLGESAERLHTSR